MKKTYSSPELVIVKLSPSTAVHQSGSLWSAEDKLKVDEGKEIGAANIEVKGFTNNLSNIWDDEW